jgi:hypothetical protein
MDKIPDLGACPTAWHLAKVWRPICQGEIPWTILSDLDELCGQDEVVTRQPHLSSCILPCHAAYELFLVLHISNVYIG